MKKLSIVIPIYNVEAYVRRAAESIAVQAFNGLEVVLVDDGSTDNSLEVCMNYLPEIDTVVVRQENEGLSSARNAGIFAASGEYILFLDADDFLLPGALENILAVLETKHPDVLFGRYLRWSPETGLSQGKVYDWQPLQDLMQRTEYILDGLPESSWNAWRYICRRRFLMDCELFFEQGMFCEDVPWTLELLDMAETLEFLPEPFYAYFQWRAGSIMNSQNIKRLTDLNTLVGRLLPNYTDRLAIYKRLVFQSFFYINECCTFRCRKDRRQLWESYKAVLPLYGGSPSRVHKIVGKFRLYPLFYVLSVSMLMLKHARRVWIRMFRREVSMPIPEYEKREQEVVHTN